MKKIILILQIATIFIGSIVGAGVCSGRELNQFFATYGITGFLGLILCGLLYIVFGKIIIAITTLSSVRSYNEFVDLICPKPVAQFINIVLTLFLLSSTSIILAGSGAIINQYFGAPKWMGFIAMIVISSLFLLRNTEGLFEVNSIVVPTLILIMSAVFFTYIIQNPEQITYSYMFMMPRQKSNLFISTMVYVSFNILTIIGVLVPLTAELRKPKDIEKGIIVGSVVLTIISVYITFLMLVNPFHPKMYEMPLLAVATNISKLLQIGILGVMWLEMFSSQVSNIYSLSHFMENKFQIKYHIAIFVVVAIAAPFSMIGFARLVEFLYPLYGVLSLVFLIYCIIFYIKNRKDIFKIYTKK
ncbi:YkvI family membrane protein [Cellulosilyticum sp. I15G10I2]|uniref:YkvI family membrane protein n=1 Tax=Cellulosilyticum sp. I15G10I2 TaxID=1892843 RepID=UPI00085BDD49|nr:transporter [Cellulosilyticum sp. I15G10I2]